MVSAGQVVGEGIEVQSIPIAEEEEEHFGRSPQCRFITT